MIYKFALAKMTQYFRVFIARARSGLQQTCFQDYQPKIQDFVFKGYEYKPKSYFFSKLLPFCPFCNTIIIRLL